MFYRASSLRILAASAVALALGACGDAPQPSPVAPAEAPLLTTSSSSVLIECPTDFEVTATDTIDVLGDTIRLTDAAGGIHQIVLPVNAVKGPTEFKVTVPAGKYVKLRVQVTNLVTGETGITFPADAQPTVAVSYKRCTRSNILNRPLHLFHVDPNTNEILDGGQKYGSKEGNTSDPRVVGKVPHFSDYAIGST